MDITIHQTVFTSNDGVLSATEVFQQRVSLVPAGSVYGKGSINLTAIRETDAGWYECRIYFPNRTPSTRPNGTWFHLSVDGGNLLTIPPTNQTIMEGKAVELTCVSKEADFSISWYKDGVLLSELPELLARSWVAPQGSLTIRQTNMADLGLYTCEVVNQMGEKQAASAYLNVTYPAKVVYSPREMFLPYGRPTLLDCHFRANPPLITLRWEKDGFLFDPLNVQGVFYRKNGSLYFEKVDETHSGEYTCTPFNSLGTDGPSPPIHVVVQRPPVFTVTPQNLYLRKVGDSIEIPCDALDGDGTHRPTIVWFKKDGTPLPTGRAFVTGGNLTVTNIQESDSGLYQCVASNEAATITTETEIMVENTAPRPPHNLTSESTTTSITVRWLAAGGRANTEYSIWYRPSDVPEWRTMRLQSRGSTEATISNLLPGREYELMVLSQDTQGDGMFSKAFRARTKAPAPGIVVDSPASPQPWHTPTNAPIEPFQQISRPENVRVDLSPDGYRVEWDPPAMGVDILSHYIVRWYRHGNQQLAETMETTDHFVEIPHLEEQSTYVFTVTAVTSSKYTADSDRLTLQVPAYGRNKVATIATVMCVALLLAAVATVWYVRRWYRNSGVKSHITST
ncbi:protein borderless-like [Macrosteles quadrilineatus]|uniref:protein borderless-like n=1 Tax=Macrosteles quadrilineatus TaxID=74068 RepID=UPI0023E1BF72|nr:protein borderless-like [Macrosteles quadrilineatus]